MSDAVIAAIISAIATITAALISRQPQHFTDSAQRSAFRQVQQPTHNSRITRERGLWDWVQTHPRVKSAFIWYLVYTVVGGVFIWTADNAHNKTILEGILASGMIIGPVGLLTGALFAHQNQLIAIAVFAIGVIVPFIMPDPKYYDHFLYAVTYLWGLPLYVSILWVLRRLFPRLFNWVSPIN